MGALRQLDGIAGVCEPLNHPTLAEDTVFEETVFEEMAARCQTMFASPGGQGCETFLPEAASPSTTTGPDRT